MRHEFDGVVGGGDGVIANAVDQFGPMAFEEVKDDTGLVEGMDVLLAQVGDDHIGVVAFGA